MSRAPARTLLWGGVMTLSLLFARGCAPTPAREMAQCVQGDLESCEHACARGTAQHEGCFGAASRIRESARGRPLDASERERLVRVLSQACQGGVARGCDDAAQTLAAPFISPPESFEADSTPRRSYPVITDETLARRRALVEQGCALEPARCEALGKACLGIDRQCSSTSLERACAAVSPPGPCLEGARRLVAESDADRLLCDQGKPYGCARLARLLHQHDRARVTQVLTRECALRALPREVPCLWKAMERATRLAPGGGFGTAGVRPPPSEAAFRELLAQAKVRVGAPTGISQQRATELVAARGPALLACYGGGLRRNPKLQGRVTVELTVDATGHAWDLRSGPSDLPDHRVIHCVVELLEIEPFEAPVGTAVRIPFDLSPE